MIRIFLCIIIGLFINSGFAKEMPKPIGADEVFNFSTTISPKKELLLEWKIAPGYYLYRDRIHVDMIASNQMKIAKINFPKGHKKTDDINGTYEVYMGDLKIPVIFNHPNAGPVNLTVHYQGCSSQGFCYPPLKKDVRIDLGQVNAQNVVLSTLSPNTVIALPESSLAKNKDQNYIQSIFVNSNYLVIVLSFLGLGLLLAFTPCVLPMIPILSSIIVGQGKNITMRKSFFLSFSYVLGMAITYAVAGMIVAMIGSSIQVFFQKTWVIVLFSALFVLLAFSLFGYYELQLPSRWQQRLNTLSNRQKSGTYIGVFLMGSLASLIVSPCVSAPLVGVLAYIAQTGDIFLGGVALLALGFGMGIPLLLIGVSAGKLLPKAGGWMETVKKVFGILLLGCAIFILSRVIPGTFTLFLWASLLIFSALFLGIFTPATSKSTVVFRGLGIVCLVYGVVLMYGAVLGNTNPLRPWEKVALITDSSSSFDVLKNMGQLDNKISVAKKTGKPIMLDFYADWCTSCIEIDRHVFNQPQVQQALSQFVLLRADVTQNNEFDQSLLKSFHVVAPPTILFFDSEGHELTANRIVGEVNVKEFLDHVKDLNLVQN